MFTDKERMILKALIEDELQSILGHGRSADPLLERYLFSLERILSKVDIEDSCPERYYAISRELAAHTTQIA